MKRRASDAVVTIAVRLSALLLVMMCVPCGTEREDDSCVVTQFNHEGSCSKRWLPSGGSVNPVDIATRFLASRYLPKIIFYLLIVKLISVYFKTTQSSPSNLTSSPTRLSLPSTRNGSLIADFFSAPSTSTISVLPTNSPQVCLSVMSVS